MVWGGFPNPPGRFKGFNERVRKPAPPIFAIHHGLARSVSENSCCVASLTLRVSMIAVAVVVCATRRVNGFKV